MSPKKFSDEEVVHLRELVNKLQKYVGLLGLMEAIVLSRLDNSEKEVWVEDSIRESLRQLYNEIEQNKTGAGA